MDEKWVQLKNRYDDLYDEVWSLEGELDFELRKWIIDGGMIFDLRDRPDILKLVSDVRNCYEQIVVVKTEIDELPLPEGFWWLP